MKINISVLRDLIFIDIKRCHTGSWKWLKTFRLTFRLKS